MATGCHISLPKPFISGDVSKWCQRFEIFSKATDWDNATMALKLPTLLEGEAAMGFTSLEEFHQRTLQPDESVSVYVHDLKQLLDQALSDLDATARKQVVLHGITS